MYCPSGFTDRVSIIRRSRDWRRREAVCGLVRSVLPSDWEEAQTGPFSPPMRASALRHWRSSGMIILIKIEMLIIYGYLFSYFGECRIHVR
jgi:hypothetical protein